MAVTSPPRAGWRVERVDDGLHPGDPLGVGALDLVDAERQHAGQHPDLPPGCALRRHGSRDRGRADHDDVGAGRLRRATQRQGATRGRPSTGDHQRGLRRVRRVGQGACGRVGMVDVDAAWVATSGPYRPPRRAAHGDRAEISGGCGGLTRTVTAPTPGRPGTGSRHRSPGRPATGGAGRADLGGHGRHPRRARRCGGPPPARRSCEQVIDARPGRHQDDGGAAGPVHRRAARQRGPPAADAGARATGAPGRRSHRDRALRRTAPRPGADDDRTERRPAPAGAGRRPRRAGSDAPVRATASTQPISSRVGRWSDARPARPTTPATTPAGRPQVVTSPATGTARRLVEERHHRDAAEPRDQDRRHPDLRRERDAERLGHRAAARAGRRRWRSARTAMASDAPTDSWNPTERTSSGSIRTRPADRERQGRGPHRLGRPSAPAVTAMAAMAEARSTDGSNRVTTPNAPITASVTAHRPRHATRLEHRSDQDQHEGHVLAGDDEQVGQPAPRKSSTISGGWSRSSPSTKPA